MKYLLAAFLLISITISSCQTETRDTISEEPWTSLWNGDDFRGWHTYLGPPYQIFNDSLGNEIPPFGIDNDPMGVITVVDIDDDKAIRITGEAWGMIYTEDDYQNYHLKMKVKWGEGMYPPRKNGPRDSGLLYHGFGEPGSFGNWMGSQELQVQEGDIGDYWPVGNVEIDIPSKSLDDKYYIYQEGAERRTYYLAEILPTATDDSLAKRRVIKAFNAEKPHGEWNDVELIALGDSSIHIVNGKVVMRLFNSRNMLTKVPLESGKIILQSEGAEVFYKDIYLRQIDEIPESYLAKGGVK